MQYQKICGVCTSEFETTRSKQKYCSNSCSIQAARSANPWNHGHKFTVEDFVDAETAVGPTESRKMYLAHKYGCSPQTVAYHQRRLGYVWRVRSRPRTHLNSSPLERTYADKKGCVICGYTRVVEVAHLLPKAAGQAAYLWNIVPLCPNHHRLFDSDRYARKFDYGKLDEVERARLDAYLMNTTIGVLAADMGLSESRLNQLLATWFTESPWLTVDEADPQIRILEARHRHLYGMVEQFSQYALP